MPHRVVLGLVLSASLAARTTAAAVDARGPDGGYAYHYFKQRVELGLEPSLIAVFSAPAAAGVAPLPVEPLAGAGLDPERIVPSGVPGWQYAEVPESMRSPLGVEMLRARLEQDGAFDFVSPVFLGTGGLPVVITRDVIVGLRTELSEVERTAFISQRIGGEVLASDLAGMDGVFHVRTTLRSAAEVLELVNGLALDPSVVFAQSDMIWWAERYGLIPNDPMFPQQWALHQPNDHDMNAPEAWAITTGDPSVVVVVLDSGIDQGHEDLNQLPGQSFTGSGTNGGPGGSCDRHGTAVAGCIAATINNSIGIVGIAPDCKVRSGKIFNEIWLFICLPFLESQDSWSANGINWAQTSGARVTNSSWGGGTASSVVTTAFNTTLANGVMHFGAAGNGGNASISYPASLDALHAVAAIDSSGAKASFSQYGPGLFISAPGAAILTTDRMGSAGYSSGNYTTIDGTSFASPYAAGVAALVLSVNPSLTPAEVADIMAQTAKDRGAPGYDTQFGWGLVDAFAAVVAASATTGPSCPADLDSNLVVDGGDLGVLLGLWGSVGQPGFPGDLNSDGLIDGADLGDLLGSWGACP